MKRCCNLEPKEGTEGENKHFKEDKSSVLTESDTNLHDKQITQQSIYQRDDNQGRADINNSKPATENTSLISSSREDNDDEINVINSSASESNVKTEGREKSVGSASQSLNESSCDASPSSKYDADDKELPCKTPDFCNESEISKSDYESKCSHGVSSPQMCDKKLHGSESNKVNENITCEFKEHQMTCIELQNPISENNGQNDQNSETLKEHEKYFCESINETSFQITLPILSDTVPSEKISLPIIETAIGDAEGVSSVEEEKSQKKPSESNDNLTSASENEDVQVQKKEENLKLADVTHKEISASCSLRWSGGEEDLLRPRQYNGLGLVKHVQNSCLPREWSVWSENMTEEVKYVRIPPHHSMYIKLKNELQSDLEVNLESLVRVENPTLWGSYLLRKAEYIARNGKGVTEEELYHITSRGNASENEKCIAKDNLNWRLCTRCKFGLGVSFSDSIKYAHRYSSRSNGMMRAVIVCRVLTCKSISISDACGMQYPSDKYDTVNARCGRVCVKFYDHEFYPEYIATYTKGSSWSFF